MREIIFRGKRVDNGEWVQGVPIEDIAMNEKNLLILISSERCFSDTTICECYEVIPETVGQYTGIKDKNGVMVFEGDIVNFSAHIFGDSRIFATTETIKYDGVGFNDSLNIGYQGYPRFCEVVGNIHDQKEDV